MRPAPEARRIFPATYIERRLFGYDFRGYGRLDQIPNRLANDAPEQWRHAMINLKILVSAH